MTITIYNSNVLGSTEDYEGEGIYVYANTEAESELDEECPE